MDDSTSQEILALSQKQLRKQFRHYSRLIRNTPSNDIYHRKRIHIALKFEQSEPLQGALADYFFACWYNIASDGEQILANAEGKLPEYLNLAFRQYIRTGEHLPAISNLATRWSVLATPSINVPKHQVYISKDDAKRVASEVSQALLAARHEGDYALIGRLENDYFSHCIACQDRMGFMITWFTLAKEDWQFHQDWQSCKTKLESLVTSANPIMSEP